MTQVRTVSREFAALIAHHRAIARQRDELAARLSASGMPVRLFKRSRDGSPLGDSHALAQADMAEPGMFRVTWFDVHGPSGHLQFNTLHAAVCEALQCGYVQQGARSC